MNPSLFIITGTSRGIGEQVARKLLERGSLVCGISRERAESLQKYKHYRHIQFDLSNISDIEQIINHVLHQINIHSMDMLGLINNAARLDPLKSIDQCTAEEISQNLQISLIAPMIVASCFIKQTNRFQGRRKVINISSGSGRYPSPQMSVYSAAKAGLDRFTQCVGLEQLEQSRQCSPVEIISFDPGMVDTELQRAARQKSEGEFKLAPYFKQAYQSGQLQTAEELGDRLIKLLTKHFDSGKLVGYPEVDSDE